MRFKRCVLRGENPSGAQRSNIPTCRHSVQVGTIRGLTVDRNVCHTTCLHGHTTLRSTGLPTRLVNDCCGEEKIESLFVDDEVQVMRRPEQEESRGVSKTKRISRCTHYFLRKAFSIEENMRVCDVRNCIAACTSKYSQGLALFYTML
jgi:hypothetical protein